MLTKKERSEVAKKAARKAVKTRKANALAKKRSEAAYKAWETRKKNKRSQAAKKAWETRRAV